MKSRNARGGGSCATRPEPEVATMIASAGSRHIMPIFDAPVVRLAGYPVQPPIAPPRPGRRYSWAIMARYRVALVVAALVIVTGCAARRPAAPPAVAAPLRVDDITALIEQGCYHCLERAYAQAQARGATQHAFESAVLLTVRSKELGLPFGDWLAKARNAAPEGPAAALYLTIADALPPDRLSEERYTLFEMGMRNVRSSVTEWRGELRSGPASELFRGYLDLALVCAFGRLSENAQSYAGDLDSVAGVPLYQYAVGICDASKAPRLQAMRTANDEFVDADYALGRFLIED